MGGNDSFTIAGVEAVFKDWKRDILILVISVVAGFAGFEWNGAMYGGIGALAGFGIALLAILVMWPVHENEKAGGASSYYRSRLRNMALY